MEEKYLILQYNRGKTTVGFNGRAFKCLSDVEQVIGFWFDVRRNNQSQQFIVIDQEEDRIERIITKEDLINEKSV